MRTRFARVLGLSAALLPLTFVSSAHAQAPANVGRQAGGQILSNVGNAVVGQPAAAVPGQPGGYGYPVTPGQAVQGMERQAIYNAAGAVTGQPGSMPGQAAWGTRYQLPGQFSGNAPGTTVNYGGTNYIVNAGGTMSPAAQSGANAMRYQLPGQFGGSTPGTTVTYGGANYVVNTDGTMSPVAAATQPAANAVRYQLPGQFSGNAPGTTVTYGGANYIVNADGTMSPTSAMVAGQPGGYEYPATPGTERRAMYVAPGTVGNQPVYASPQTASATQYQLPAQFSESAPGTTVTYGGASYVINNGGTMSPVAR
jgi:hypothetical protein